MIKYYSGKEKKHGMVWYSWLHNCNTEITLWLITVYKTVTKSGWSSGLRDNPRSTW